MYTLAMTIDHYYWKCDCECHCTRQAEKEVFKSHSQKQEKTFTSSPATASQNKINLSLMASSTKTFFLKLSLFPTSKKQLNSLQMDLSFKLASNGKLTSNEHKKYLENNLYLYCSIKDYKLDSCPKK